MPAKNPKNPTPVRLNEDDERALALIPGNRSDILRRGIHLQAAEWTSQVPLYANDVREQSIQEAVEEAAAEACRRLDDLFPGAPKERGGIGSQFQGVLVEHLAAMLTGREYSQQSYARAMPALFGDWRTFGRVTDVGGQEGVTLLKVPERLDGEQLFYDGDKGRFVPLASVSVGALFTSSEAAVTAGYAWLRAEGLSPRECQLRLCVLSYGAEGPPKVARIGAP